MKRPEVPRLFRILLQVQRLERAQRFYESLLATRGRAVGGARVYFESGPMLLALLEPSADGETDVSVLPEPLYFATTDLEGVYRRARRLGCLATDLIHNDPASPAGSIVVRPWGERSFYAVDPSGNPLCFVDSATLFTGANSQATRRKRSRPTHPTRRSQVARRQGRGPPRKFARTRPR